MVAWSGLYNGVHGVDYSVIGAPSVRKRIRRALKPMVAIKYKEILRTLVTDDVGATALATHTRIVAETGLGTGNPHDSGSFLGGKRNVETVTDVNRAVTSADQTQILQDIDGVDTPTFPQEKSGNSGGGKLGF
jgi:hypothetical protein